MLLADLNLAKALGEGRQTWMVKPMGASLVENLMVGGSLESRLSSTSGVGRAGRTFVPTLELHLRRRLEWRIHRDFELYSCVIYILLL